VSDLWHDIAPLVEYGWFLVRLITVGLKVVFKVNDVHSGTYSSAGASASTGASEWQVTGHTLCVFWFVVDMEVEELDGKAIRERRAMCSPWKHSWCTGTNVYSLYRVRE